MKYIITNVKGIPYYLRERPVRGQNKDTYEWEGLKDNASKFNSEREAFERATIYLSAGTFKIIPA